MDDLLLPARALVLADLEARGLAHVGAVSVLEEAVTSRRWWAEQWAEGAAYVPGLVAQDVQDALLDAGTRWPECRLCPDDEPVHVLRVAPELGGPDPVWVCEERGEAVAPLGRLSGPRPL